MPQYLREKLMENKDKAKRLSDLIYDVLSTCGGKCSKCALKKVCDDLDVLYFQLMQID